ncbi:CPBP family intramembrane glutamic endopeptidase [Flavobacterium maritimum]|uniref:CPBP family intramembrane glutamic endopeptidase n=1 Tax=Flavobacterium maritimum TaxID=3149042 RepID=UPI0034DAF843
MYFRGFINTLFINHGISFNLTVVFSSVIFTVAHIMSFNPAETSYFWLLGILFMGILFSILYEKFNSIFVPIGLHIIWDFISFGLVGRNDFKGFFIDNFQIFSKNLDDIETIIIFSLILLLFLRDKYIQNRSNVTKLIK